MAPQENKDKQAVFSDEVLDKIANGESIDYDGITILGDLDLSDLNLVKKLKERHLLVCLPVIISTIRITNARIEGALTMDRAIFEEDVDFTGTKFAGPVSLTEARLKGYVSFNGSQFEDAANFGRCRFDQFADFSGSAFQQDTYFVEAIFNEDCNFRGARFGKDVYFGGAIMQKYADFSESSFQSYASFRGSHFLGYAYFSESQFSGDASFSGTQFESDASFMVSKFESDAFFTGARFNGYLSLMRSRFKEIADFSKSKFESDIYLTEARLSSVKLNWNSIKGHAICDGATYLQLVSIFKDQEQFKEADDCYCEYRNKSKRAKSWTDSSKYLDYVAHFTCGYGIRPINTIYLSITLILAFAGILWLGNQGFSPLDSIYYSALAFVADPKGPGLAGAYKYLFMMERLLGWLLMALFLVTLGRVMIR